MEPSLRPNDIYWVMVVSSGQRRKKVKWHPKCVSSGSPQWQLKAMASDVLEWVQKNPNSQLVKKIQTHKESKAFPFPKQFEPSKLLIDGKFKILYNWCNLLDLQYPPLLVGKY